MAEHNDLSVQVLLAKFRARRDEIAERSKAQAGLVNLTITAIGVLGGLNFSHVGDRRLLLLIPAIVLPLGLLWLDHASNIFQIGDFIKDEIMPRLRAEANIPDLPDYENIVRVRERSKCAVLQKFGLPLGLIFIVPSIISLVFAYEFQSKDWVFNILFVMDIVLLLVFCVYWWPFFIGPRPNSSSQKNEKQ